MGRGEHINNVVDHPAVACPLDAEADKRLKFSWTFERYFIRQIIPWFALSTISLALIFLTTQAVRVGPVFAGSGASFFETVQAVVLVLVPVIGWAFTPAFCVAVFAATGRMVADGELTALDSAGVSRSKLWAGPLLLTMIFFLISGWIWVDLAPRSQSNLRGLAVDLAGRAIQGRLKPNRFSNPITGVTFFADSKSPDGTFQGIFIEDSRSPDRTIRLAATSATITADTSTQSLKAILAHGTGFITSQADSSSSTALTFESMDFNIPLADDLTRSLDFLPLSLSVPTKQLLAPPPLGQDPSKWTFAFWTRIAAPLGFLTISILSIALALGLAIQRKGIAVTVAATLFMTYHLLGRFCESLLDTGKLGPETAALAPVVLIAALGTFALIATRAQRHL